MPAKVSINGAQQGSGHSIQVTDGQLIVDGQAFELATDRAITIEIQGDVGDLIVGACDEVTVTGSVGALNVQQGDVQCGDVAGSVSAGSGNVVCGHVGGAVSAMSGDVRCGDVAGPVSALGGNVERD